MAGVQASRSLRFRWQARFRLSTLWQTARTESAANALGFLCSPYRALPIACADREAYYAGTSLPHVFLDSTQRAIRVTGWLKAFYRTTGWLDNGFCQQFIERPNMVRDSCG